jgi:hypothetical protein
MPIPPGAIAGMLAGALDGPQALPRRWLNAFAPEIRRACEVQTVALLRLGAQREQNRQEDLASVRVERLDSGHQVRQPQ